MSDSSELYLSYQPCVKELKSILKNYTPHHPSCEIELPNDCLELENNRKVKFTDSVINRYNENSCALTNHLTPLKTKCSSNTGNIYGTTLIVFSLLIYIIIAGIIMISAVYKNSINHNIVTLLIMGWFVFNILICIYECLMIYNRRDLYLPDTYICSHDNTCKVITNSFWTRRYGVSDLANKRFWLDGWSEYGRYDRRYLDPSSFTHILEGINAFVSFIPFILAIVYILLGYDWRTGWIKWMLVAVSAVQLFFTIIYLVTLIPVANQKYYPYVLFNIPWVLFPLMILIVLLAY